MISRNDGRFRLPVGGHRWLGIAAALLAAALLPVSGASAEVLTSTGTELPTNGTSTGVAISQNLALVGEDPSLAGQSGSPSVAVLSLGANGWSRMATLTPPTGANLVGWGHTVAVEAGNPLTAVVGGNGTEVDVYVLNQGGKWTLEQQIPAPVDMVGGSFGGTTGIGGPGGAYRLALSGDTLAVGDPFESSAPVEGVSTGAVWIYTRTNDTWTQAKKLTGPGAFGQFGSSVALSGGVLLATAPNINNQDGAVFVYSGSGGNWSSAATLTDPNDAASEFGGSASAEFGSSVALDGDTAVVGQDQFVSPNCPIGTVTGGRCDHGAAWVFRQGGSPSSWSVQGPPLTSAGFPDSAGAFGTSVAINGGHIVVGSPNANVFDDTAGQTAYLFIKTSLGGAWTPSLELKPPTCAGGCAFGESVATNGTAHFVGMLNQSARVYP
jgi:hypothetical protein